MTKKTKEEIQALIGVSELLGVEVDPNLHRELKESKILELANKIKNTKKIEAKQPEVIVEELLTETVPSLVEEEPNIIEKVYDILKGTRKPEQLNEQASVESRIRNLERNLANIGNVSSGGGEVRLMNLDDVNRDSVGIDPAHVLKYNPTTKLFEFGPATGETGPQGPQGPPGIVSPSDSLEFLEAPSSVPPRTIAYNTAEDCLDVHQTDGTICQVGMETYAQIYNASVNNIPPGTLVSYVGVHSNGVLKPSVGLFLSDQNGNSEAVIGITTTNVAPSSSGRATYYGRVHDLNTTGAPVGETWVAGDPLYASPFNPGKLTKVKPITPNLVYGVGYVLKAHATEGIIFVRTVTFPRSFFGNWHSNQNQVTTAINTPHAITFNVSGGNSGFTITNDRTITALHSGLYKFQLTVSLAATEKKTGHIWIWGKKNGVNIPNSTVKSSVGENDYVVSIYSDLQVAMSEGDTLEVWWAESRGSVMLQAETAIAFAPTKPSAKLNVFQINQ